MLDPGETFKRLEAAVVEARAFFGIDPLYIITLQATLDNDGAAGIDAGDGYLRCAISFSMDYYQRNPEIIRRDMAHEVAHLMANEVLQLQKRMPEEWQDKNAPAGGMFADAIETLTSRLERLFIRECPGPVEVTT